MNAHDLRETMSGEPDWQDADETGEARFWMPQPFNDGMLWAGRFKGTSPWERHADTDELLCTLEGSFDVTVLTDDGPVTTAVPAGSVFVVPRGRWHRVSSEDETVAYGVTPGSTEHSFAEDPRAGE